ncbi:MAG: alpha/beta hydrolase [Isosphaeraceae bacterium]|nr:alpha/beta hydrolase [Isosphaeraceae bacterium]
MALPSGRPKWACTVVVGAVLAALAAGDSSAQNAQEKEKTKAARAKGKNTPVAKKAPNALDPLAAAAGKTAPPPGTFHYTFKIISYDRTPLAASYYPSRLGLTAPVLLLVHEKDRSRKDFTEPIADLKGVGLAEHMQAQGYAVLSFDLRGHGENLRRPLASKEWRMMAGDLQAAYRFLVDRTNRGELNLGKLGVIGVGEGANLVAAWAALPGGAVSIEGRVSDLGAVVLISPLADGEGFLLREVASQLAQRFPMLVMAGQRDASSAEPVLAIKPLIERDRKNKVELFPSSLHGYKLLRLEPKATSILARFLEGTVKYKALEWTPRYNLTPVATEDIQVVRNTKTVEPAKAKAEEKEAPANKAKDEAKDQEAAPAKK